MFNFLELSITYLDLEWTRVGDLDVGVLTLNCS